MIALGGFRVGLHIILIAVIGWVYGVLGVRLDGMPWSVWFSALVLDLILLVTPLLILFNFITLLFSVCDLELGCGVLVIC